jgi:3-hydroxyisobutyrate dehydrogenase-like beta-hydroxyacid dehydrogenase
MRVGFIGMGRMGQRMARNVLRSGFPLTIFNRTPDRCAALEAEGAAVATSPAGLAAAADVVITMVTDGPALLEVTLGPNGALAALAPGTVLIDMSTTGPAAIRELAVAASPRGVEVLDAPVSGATPLAESAQLSAIVGGDRATFERVRPVLATMTRSQTYVGPSGAGATMKLAVNSLVIATNHAIAEALVLAERCGIAREVAYDVLLDSAAASPYMRYKREHFLKPASQPVATTVAIVRKDLDLALGMAREAGLPMPMVAIVAELLTAASSYGGAERDIVAVADLLRALSGATPAADDRSVAC